MKEIETLLQRYAEGTLDNDGLDELNRLTHRTTVISHATKQAAIARRRRMTRSVASIALLVVVATGFTLFLRPASLEPSAGPLVAQQPTETIPETASLSATSPSLTPDEVSTAKAVRAKGKTPAMVSSSKAQPIPASVEKHVTPVVMEEVASPIVEEVDQVVVCNTQCSPDSVINDIWRFLRV